MCNISVKYYHKITTRTEPHTIKTVGLYRNTITAGNLWAYTITMQLSILHYYYNHHHNYYCCY